MKNRQEYIDRCREKYDIDLDPEKIKRNEGINERLNYFNYVYFLGLRYLAKLCLNNLCKCKTL